MANYVFPIPGYTGNPAASYHDIGATDLMAPKGTPVLNIISGVIEGIGNDALGGNWVMIKGDDGRDYYYAHFDTLMSGIVGGRVDSGAQLGTVGNTGNAAGKPPHLHIGIGYGIQSGSGPSGGSGLNFDAKHFLSNLLSQTGAAIGGVADAAGAVIKRIIKWSPFDDLFKKYAGDLSDDDEFIKIVAGISYAESGWNTNNTSGDNGHAWGLFQMHDQGQGAGYGDKRLDPDFASSIMVPKFAAAYKQGKQLGLVGGDLASYVGRMVERPSDYQNPQGTAGLNYQAGYRYVSTQSHAGDEVNIPGIVGGIVSGIGGAIGGIGGGVTSSLWGNVSSFFSTLMGKLATSTLIDNAGIVFLMLGITFTAFGLLGIALSNPQVKATAENTVRGAVTAAMVA